MYPFSQTDIKTSMMKYQNKITQLLNQFQNNSNKSNALIAKKKIQGLRLIAQGFTIYACHNIKDDYIKVDEQIKLLTTSTDLKSIDPKLLLGFCIKQQLFHKQLFKTISNRLSRNDQQYSQLSTVHSNSFHPTQDFKIQIDDSIDDFQSDYSVIIQSQQLKIQSDNTQQTDSILLTNLQFSQANYNNDYIQNQNQQIKQYLYKLQRSTTQLNHLHQRMKWSKPTFIESKSKINMVLFSCKCQQIILLNNQQFLTFTSQCPGAVSKKQSRRIACLFLLRKIYNQLPQVWEKFMLFKKLNPGLQQPLNTNNQSIFKKTILQTQISDVSQINLLNQQSNEPLTQQIKQYLNKIKSCKNEMNLLIGQFKKISPPEISAENQDQLSLWPVKITLHDDQTVLTAKERDASKKRAQQKCIKQLLQKLFQRDPPRWKSFVAYKQNKKLS